MSACGLWLTCIQAAGVSCMKLRSGKNQAVLPLLVLAGRPTFLPRPQSCSDVLQMSCHCGVFCFLLSLTLHQDQRLGGNRPATGHEYVSNRGPKVRPACRSGAIKWAKFHEYLQILRPLSPAGLVRSLSAPVEARG